MERRPARTQPAEPAWEKLVEGVAGETGERFFAALVRSLSETLGVAGAWVTEYLPADNRLRAHALWLDGKLVPDYEYQIAGTPCEPVIATEKLLHFPDRIVELFPGDPDLRAFNAVSYVGQRLDDLDGTILGHLAVLDTKPLPADATTLALFRVFAARAAAELRRLRAVAELQKSERTLRRLIDSALDAIVEFDTDLRITMMNPAAAKLFGCQRGAALGEELARFLTEDGRRTVESLVERLQGEPTERSSTWIPSGLRARSSSGASFPAEATLSRSVGETRSYYTLILRNVDEKRQAERRIAALQAETRALRSELRELQGSEEILGRSPGIRRVLEQIREVGPTEATVLILGETGTGKELVARAIHAASSRSGRPFVTVNCAAIPSNLIESELFGHEKGAFTGATRQRKGRFALADGGTLFLDEIGELPTELQTRLLRVLQEKQFEPVGSSRPLEVDVRILAATHRDLQRAVDRGTFREDLYYRLNVYPLHLPPLRDRGEDVVLLAESFARRYSRSMGRPIEPLDAEVAGRLGAYDWPGNIRELQNVIERAVITSADGHLDLRRAFPEIEAAGGEPAAPGGEAPGAGSARVWTAAEVAAFERANIERALEASRGKVSGKGGAAELLGMNPSTLASKIKALGLKS